MRTQPELVTLLKPGIPPKYRVSPERIALTRISAQYLSYFGVFNSIFPNAASDHLPHSGNLGNMMYALLTWRKYGFRKYVF